MGMQPLTEYGNDSSGLSDRSKKEAMNRSGEEMGTKESHVPDSKARLVLAGLVLLALAAGSVASGGCGTKKVSLAYEPSPEAAIVTVSAGGGLPFPGDDLAPTFQLFGDGSFLAREERGCGSVLVRGSFDKTEVEDLLRRLADTGFFGLEDEYADPDVHDATFRKILVSLAETGKAVTVWMTRDVPAFDAAYDLILGYPRGETEDHVPREGYLVVVRGPLDDGGDRHYLDPGEEIFGLLPDVATLDQAVSAHTAVAVDGADFVRLKEYENAQETRGLRLLLPEYILVVYPVYQPRLAEKPGTPQ